MMNNNKMASSTTLAKAGVNQVIKDVSIQMTHAVHELTKMGDAFLEVARQFVQQSTVLGN